MIWNNEWTKESRGYERDGVGNTILKNVVNKYNQGWKTKPLTNRFKITFET